MSNSPLQQEEEDEAATQAANALLLLRAGSQSPPKESIKEAERPACTAVAKPVPQTAAEGFHKMPSAVAAAAAAGHTPRRSGTLPVVPRKPRLFLRDKTPDTPRPLSQFQTPAEPKTKAEESGSSSVAAAGAKRKSARADFDSDAEYQKFRATKKIVEERCRWKKKDTIWVYKTVIKQCSSCSKKARAMGMTEAYLEPGPRPIRPPVSRADADAIIRGIPRLQAMPREQAEKEIDEIPHE